MQWSLKSILVAASLSLAIAPAAFAGAPDPADAAKHNLDMYKVEQFVGLQAGDSADGLDVSCPNGDYAVDGMWRVDQVNFNAQIDDEGPFGPWDRYNGVDVYQSESVAKDTWEFTIVNNTDEDAQAKVWVTCLGKKTSPDTQQHNIQMSDLYESTDVVEPASVWLIWAGNHTCAKDEISVAHGFHTDGLIKMYRSWPGDTGMRHWEFGFYAPGDDPNVGTSVRCLKIKTDWAGTKKHRHVLKIKFRSQKIGVKPKFVDAVKQDCGEQEKGLVGAFDVRTDHNDWGANYGDHQLEYIGQEPQIKSRVFHIWNINDSVLKAKIGAICFNDRTSGPQRY